MRKGRLLLLSLIFIAFGAGQIGAETLTRWKIGHIRQSGSAVDKAVHQLIEQISNGSKNSFIFDVYSGNRLGDYSVVQERVSFGEVQLYVGPLATSIDKRLLLATLPYLVNSWSEAQKVYVQGSELLTIIEKLLEHQNIKLLGGWPVYFGGIGLREIPVAPENPDVSKKMIIRVPPIRSFELTAKELGYTAYPITWTYATMGLKTGMVDGIIGGGAEGYNSFRDSIRYYIPIKDHFEYWFIYMNLDAWKQLSKDDQLLFRQSVKEMEEQRYRVAEKEEKKSIDQLRLQGVEVLELSQEQLEKIKQKVRSKVWPLLEKEIGPEFSRLVSELN